MHGCDEMQESLFVMSRLEDYVAKDHPLRPMRELVNQALKRLDGLFNLIHADTGRASIAPEKLMRALLLQVFYSVRSERMLMEQMRYSMLFRCFAGLWAWRWTIRYETTRCFPGIVTGSWNTKWGKHSSPKS